MCVIVTKETRRDDAVTRFLEGLQAGGRGFDPRSVDAPIARCAPRTTRESNKL